MIPDHELENGYFLPAVLVWAPLAALLLLPVMTALTVGLFVWLPHQGWRTALQWTAIALAVWPHTTLGLQTPSGSHGQDIAWLIGPLAPFAQAAIGRVLIRRPD